MVTKNALLLEYVRETFPELTNSKSKRMLELGMIIVNDEITTRHSHPLKPGDKIRFSNSPQPRGEKIKARSSLPILYEDSSLLVINKPEGLLTIATETSKTHNVYYKLTAYVRSKDPKRRARVFIVHRLDRDASGILVFAKTEKTKEFLQENWRKFEKKYYAVVEGVPEKPEGTLKSYLVEDKFRRVYSTAKTPESKLSITHYKVLENWEKYTLLEISLETGRKNQIRVHLADFGFPIAGDEKYRAETNPIKRLALHAFYLSFNHPVTHERKTFTTSVPNLFSKKNFK